MKTSTKIKYLELFTTLRNNRFFYRIPEGFSNRLIGLLTKHGCVKRLKNCYQWNIEATPAKALDCLHFNCHLTKINTD